MEDGILRPLFFCSAFETPLLVLWKFLIASDVFCYKDSSKFYQLGYFNGLDTRYLWGFGKCYCYFSWKLT